MNLVAGVIGFALFAMFTGFLAYRIGEWPLGLIVVAAIAMALLDLLQDIRKPG